ncbi:MAG TPA: SEC-C metal-binding domain-containing protein [Clostridia bacterium]|nr:SEC-C metal-binding domain-containing protein [Clostridia bacterium]
MGLYQDWKDYAQVERDQREHDAFWKEYFALETESYKKLLAEHGTVKRGKLSELAATFAMDEKTFAGFLDGINSSLKTELDLDKLEGDSEIALDVDYEKLYFNMHEARADWLWNLPEWDGVLSEERRREITKEFRASKIYVNTGKIGRNDPCPCGSGKKYKNCCGKNA